MSVITKFAAAAIAIVGLNGAAHAETFEAFSAPGFTTETTTVPGSYVEPTVGAGDTLLNYSVLSTEAGFSNTATIDFATPQTSYTFLWGTPDTYNTVSDGSMSVTGSGMNNGVYTFADANGFSSLTFSTTGVAFELAQVAPVPEPSTWALALAGLAAVGFVSRNRKRG